MGAAERGWALWLTCWSGVGCRGAVAVWKLFILGRALAVGLTCNPQNGPQPSRIRASAHARRARAGEGQMKKREFTEEEKIAAIRQTEAGGRRRRWDWSSGY